MSYFAFNEGLTPKMTYTQKESKPSLQKIKLNCAFGDSQQKRLRNVR